MDDAQTYSDGYFCPGISSVQQKRTGSAEPSCVSMKSDQSMDPPLRFNDGNTLSGCKSNIYANTCSVKPMRTESAEHSCVSMKSDQSMNPPLFFNDGNTSGSRKRKHSMKENLPKPSHVPVKRDCSVDQPILSSGGNTARRVVVAHPHRRTDTSTVFSHEVLSTFRSNLMKKFECLYEGTAKQGNPTLLNEIYTELYITESESGEISNDHEVRQIETQSRRAATEDTPIKCSDIFRALPGQDKAIRAVLTKGVAGIGKTVSVQKFILDWAEEKENQDIQLIFPLPFRELNLMKNKTLRLSDLLHIFFPETKGKENQDVQLIFPLPFRELNLMKGKTLFFSLSDLLQDSQYLDVSPVSSESAATETHSHTINRDSRHRDTQ
ncbi:uncharacterized protein LOC107669864 [Sinocyclocheilus anshuiensis]|uniref:uncharacterized protein LOC107669864 n=1 Tax=Sinocyclocheilus anshuiensis TaxID=1608454 RepID=UPI0007B9707E|nr:PREDICTED: uncharacterized protein LOC107669864 [Sinocyclocheilus anshuiensis]